MPASKTKPSQKEKQAKFKGDQVWQKENLVRNNLVLVLLTTLGLVIILSLFDLAGPAGRAVKKFLTIVVGWTYLLTPLIIFAFVYLLSKRQKIEVNHLRGWGVTLIYLSLLGLSHLVLVKPQDSLSVIGTTNGGGYLGFLISAPVQYVLGRWGGIVVLIALFVTGLILTFNLSVEFLWRKLLFIPGQQLLFFCKKIFNLLIVSRRQTFQDRTVETEGVDEFSDFVSREVTTATTPAASKRGEEPVTKDFIKPGKKFLPLKSTTAASEGPLPQMKIQLPLDLLSNRSQKPSSGDIKANKEIIQRTLRNFGIEVSLGEAKVGPTVTQYTLSPAEGVRLSQITALANDLALALAAHPIRIEAPIPGQSLVGIEVPNINVATVTLREVLESEEFKAYKGYLNIALGKDVAGQPQITDLARLPHLLIAGATGSGKTVALNALIMSLLYQHQPHSLKLILIDPKRVELPVYNDIPFLLTPVITQFDQTINALRWSVAEMDRRFSLLQQRQTRDIKSYNRSVAEADKLPWLVIVIDELADLMAVAAAEVETAIVRLSQMARAVGIHLVVATQRPSVDIITGLIKANITARIAFATASQIDSRTILDSAGAEKLLGRGDMLFINAQLSKPKRIQGAYVSDQEIEAVVSFLKQQCEPQYDSTVIEKSAPPLTEGGGAAGEEDTDALLEEAKQVVLRAKKASATFLQRRLRIGYARAARLLDLLEEQGIVGPAKGAKPREVYIDQNDDFNAVQGEQNSAELDPQENKE